ncbi:MAG: protein kinase, partial [Acidobacteria bacterium]|nr:protein kinase [Acidobacteriota bacterium]
MAKKILLIEYEPRYLDRIRGHLAGKDFDLVVAKDGEEGLEAYKRGRPDLVLVSSVLPKLRTPDVIKGMQGMGGTPPILLMMSGYKGKNKRADAQRVGATSILEKPFSEEVFLEEIGAALGGRSAPANDPFPTDGQTGAGLLSADDIFSDVLSGMEDEGRPVASVNQGTDPGIQKKLEQTLSGILPAPRRSSAGTTGSIPKVDPPKPAPPAPAPAPRPPAPVAPAPPARPAEPMDGGDRTVRLDLTGAGGPAVIPPPPSSVRDSSASIANKAAVSTSVDKMLTDTLSGLKVRPASGPAAKPDTGPIPRPVAAPAPPAPAREKTPPPTEKLARPAEPVRAEPPAPPAPRPAPKPAPEPPRETFRPPEPPRREEKRRDTSTSVPMATGPGAFGRYQLLEKIAAGGMAEVYKARMKGEEGFEKIVAIKRILPHMADNDDFITMFVDEAKLAAQLTHNNIIHIYDLGRVDAYHYIAMEYVEGKDLRSILKMGQERGYPLPPELALFIASKIGNALEYAHRRVGMDGKELNLVHRDVSPQNILISFEGDIKLCDFGIAKAATKVSQTQTGALKGKLQYMSPEQAWGKKIDRRTDIFSLGIVLFEMLTGERLFTGDTDLTILEQVRDAKVVAPSTKNYELPKKVDQVVLKALAKNPQDRYQNANEFEKDINSILYSYQPTPGPADLAIYMHRLLESQPAVSDEQIDAAFAMADTGGPLVEEKKKGKGLVISKKEKPKAAPAPAPEPVVPAVTEVSQPALSMGREEPKSRMGLYVGIGVGVVALGAVGFFLTRGSGTKPPEAQPTPAPIAATS